MRREEILKQGPLLHSSFSTLNRGDNWNVIISLTHPFVHLSILPSIHPLFNHPSIRHSELLHTLERSTRITYLILKSHSVFCHFFQISNGICQIFQDHIAVWSWKIYLSPLSLSILKWTIRLIILYFRFVEHKCMEDNKFIFLPE